MAISPRLATSSFWNTGLLSSRAPSGGRAAGTVPLPAASDRARKPGVHPGRGRSGARSVTFGYQGAVRRDPPPTRRRTSRPRRPHRQPWPPAGPARRSPSPVGGGLLVLAALGLGALATTLLYAPVLLLLFALTGLLVATVVILPMELVKSAGRPVERVAPADPAPGPAWAGTRERYDRLRGEYAAYECDPLAVLRLPALADVAVPSTARFVDALAEAQAVCTEEHPGEPRAARFVAAAEHAEQAWQAARDAAGRIRLGALDPAE